MKLKKYEKLKPCPFCGEPICPIVFAPYDPCMPYIVLKDEQGKERMTGVKTFICRSCGSIVTEVQEREQDANE